MAQKHDETLEQYRATRPFEALEDLEIAHGHKTESNDIVFLLRMVREQKELAKHVHRTGINLEAKLRAVCEAEIDDDPAKLKNLNIYQLVSKLANGHFYALAAKKEAETRLRALQDAVVNPWRAPSVVALTQEQGGGGREDR